MSITSAKYIRPKDEEGNFIGENDSILIVEDGVKKFVPLSEGNQHYQKIMEMVDAGDLTIADAD